MLHRLGLMAFGVLLAVGIGASLHSAGANSPVPTPAAPALSPVLSERSDSTRLGVVWTPPAAPDSAVLELGRIAALGATAVRVSRLPADAVAARADSLGLRLYVDLPTAYASPAQLRSPRAETAPTLERLRVLARRHASITHVGLAHGADTTVPAVCTSLRRWADRAGKEDAPLRTYYVTPFTAAADRCAETVDQVLLDLRGHPAPVERWQRWQSKHPNTGLGAMGTWVRPAAGTGLRVPHSPERQARYLETAFSKLLAPTRPSPPAAFVARWQDRPESRLSSRRYGLHDATGSPRPATRVVQGVYTGAQRTFAFPTGTEPPPSPHGPVLVGWGLVALLGGLYAQNVFVRQTVARYFTAPEFYRDALREGHDLHPGANGLLLLLVAGALGTMGIHAARLVASWPGTTHVLAALPPDLQLVLAGAVERPVAAGLVTGGLVLTVLLIWTGALVLVARQRAGFSFAQGLVLVVWPCWPVLVAVPFVLATGPETPVSPSWFARLVGGGGGLALVSVTLRVLYDYWVATDLSGPTVCLMGLLSPLALAGGIAVGLIKEYEIPVRLLWHLITST